MKVIKPSGIWDDQFVSSTVAENDCPEWHAATSYSIGDHVIRVTVHKVYEALQSGIDATLPENATTGATPRWLEVSPTNRWKMFDNVVEYATAGTTPMTVVIQPGIIDSVALVGLADVATVHVTLHDGATLVYDQTVSLDATTIGDWYEYFFEPYDVGTDAVFEDIPPYETGTLTVTFTSAGSLAVGGLIVGIMRDLGETLSGASASITDYSRKEANAFGITTLVQRSYSKRMSTKLLLTNDKLRRVQTTLADIRATPCVWIGAKDTVKFAPLVVYGYYRDFNLDIAYADYSYCNLEIEGLI